MKNPYMPYPVRIDDIQVATEDKSLKTFKFVVLGYVFFCSCFRYIISFF